MLGKIQPIIGKNLTHFDFRYFEEKNQAIVLITSVKLHVNDVTLINTWYNNFIYIAKSEKNNFRTTNSCDLFTA